MAIDHYLLGRANVSPSHFTCNFSGTLLGDAHRLKIDMNSCHLDIRVRDIIPLRIPNLKLGKIIKPVTPDIYLLILHIEYL